MPNGAVKHVDLRHARIVPYRTGALSGMAAESMASLDPAALPWDESSEDLAQAGFERVKRSRTRGVLRFLANGAIGTSVCVFAKRCKVSVWTKRIGSLFVRCKSRREWDLGWELLRRGIPTAMPLLWAERRRFGMVAENYLVLLGIDRSASFLAVWRNLTTQEMRLEWLGRLAHFVRAAHEKGFAHDDLSAEHVLVVAGYPTNQSPPQLYFIDLDHGRIGDKVSPYRRAHNFFQIFRSLPSDLLGPEERRAFLVAYSEGKWADGDIERVEHAIRMIGTMKRFRKMMFGAGHGSRGSEI